MPVDNERAKRDWARGNRKIADKYISDAGDDAKKIRVLDAAGYGTDQERAVWDAIHDSHDIGSPADDGNPFRGTRTAEMLREKAPAFGEYDTVRGMSDELKKRLMRSGAFNKSAGDLVNDVFNRYEKRLDSEGKR